jgi:hypothetical protein
MGFYANHKVNAGPICGNLIDQFSKIQGFEEIWTKKFYFYIVFNQGV